MFVQLVGQTNESIISEFIPKLNFRVQIHYGMLDQHVDTTSWTKMLYQLVGPTFHTNFGVEVNSAIIDSFACQTCWYNKFVQHSKKLV